MGKKIEHKHMQKKKKKPMIREKKGTEKYPQGSQKKSHKRDPRMMR